MEESKIEVKRVIEALLFATAAPLPLKKIQAITAPIHPFSKEELTGILEQLRQEYLERSFRLEEIAGGYLLRTCPEYREYIQQMMPGKREEKLSQSSLEVLSIIAYKQPITKPQIEAIRGVDCSGILQSLLDKELVEVKGQLEVPGRPNLYAVTSLFLHLFGLNSAEQLRQL